MSAWTWCKMYIIYSLSQQSINKCEIPSKIWVCIGSQHHWWAAKHPVRHGTGPTAVLSHQGLKVPFQSMIAVETGTAWSHAQQRSVQDTWSPQSRRACSSNEVCILFGKSWYSPVHSHQGIYHTCMSVCSKMQKH